MSEASWPSPNHNARAVTDTEYPHLAPWNSDGVFPAASDLVYANGSGLQVFVRANRYAIVQGHAWTSGATELALPVAPNNDGAARTDIAVLRLDRSTWDVTAAVRQGTPGSGAPPLVRDPGDAGVFEIPLADITVDAGAASIAAGKVRTRPLLQSAAVRPCRTITDIQAVLATGDLVFETSTGRWIAWDGAAGVVLHEDTGWRTMTLTNTAWEPSAACVARRHNGLVTLRIAVQRVHSTFTKSDPDGSPLFTVPTDFKPTFGQFGVAQFSDGVATARLDVSNVTGIVSFQHNSADVPAGRTALVSFTYPLG